MTMRQHQDHVDSPSSVRLPFGFLEGRIVAVGDVARGLACRCTCPGCGAPLIARQGSRAWCFAHYRSPGTIGCLETAIHLAAKQALLDAGALVVPAYTVTLSARGADGRVHRVARELSSARRIRFDRVELEVECGAIRPDAVGYRSGRQLLVEMFVTHQVDRDKLAKLAALGIPALEINLSDLSSAGSKLSATIVASRVVDIVAHKTWLIHPGTKRAYAEMKIELAEMIFAADAYAQARAASAEGKRVDCERRRQARALGVDISEGSPEARAPSPAIALPDELLRPDLHTARLALPSYAWQALMYQQFVTRRFRALTGFGGADLFNWAAHSVGLINKPGRATAAVLRDYAEHLVRQKCLCVIEKDREGRMVRFQLPEEPGPLRVGGAPSGT